MSPKEERVQLKCANVATEDDVKKFPQTKGTFVIDFVPPTTKKETIHNVHNIPEPVPVIVSASASVPIPVIVSVSALPVIVSASASVPVIVSTSASVSMIQPTSVLRASVPIPATHILPTSVLQVSPPNSIQDTTHSSLFTDSKSPVQSDVESPVSPIRSSESKFHSFKVTSSSKPFVINDYYKFDGELGYGVTSVVCCCIDTRTQTKVAIKKVISVYKDIEIGKRVLRELILLRFLKNQEAHPNILSICDILEPCSHEPNMGRDDVYIVTEYMESNLSHVLRNTPKNILTVDHMIYFSYQILCALNCMHSYGIWHRDLKPANVFMNADCSLKVGDFGLSRQKCAQQRNPETGELYTSNVVTTWYRAPELLTCSEVYDGGIDVWSLACIMIELITNVPLFQSENSLRGMTDIFNIFGVASIQDCAFICEHSRSRDSILPVLLKLRQSKDFENKTFMKWCENLSKTNANMKLVLSTNLPYIQLIESMMQFNPTNRCTIRKALENPIFDKWRVPELEMCRGGDSKKMTNVLFDVEKYFSKEELSESFGKSSSAVVKRFTLRTLLKKLIWKQRIALNPRCYQSYMRWRQKYHKPHNLLQMAADHEKKTKIACKVDAMSNADITTTAYKVDTTECITSTARKVDTTSTVCTTSTAYKVDTITTCTTSNACITSTACKADMNPTTSVADITL